jgi:TetR/AcrR family transcriptional repressor of nem operon
MLSGARRNATRGLLIRPVERTFQYVARSREFDLDHALDRAVQLFWRRGYAATTVRELCDAMKISIASFYAAFADKQTCFRRALVRYIETQPLPRVPSHEAIRRWFEIIVDPARSPKGCLLVGSAVESPLLDPRAREAVQATLASIDDFFVRCLTDRATEAARADARVLTAAVTAIHVLARAGVPAAHLRATADRAMDLTNVERTF